MPIPPHTLVYSTSLRFKKYTSCIAVTNEIRYSFDNIFVNIKKYIT